MAHPNVTPGELAQRIASWKQGTFDGDLEELVSQLIKGTERLNTRLRATESQLVSLDRAMTAGAVGKPLEEDQAIVLSMGMRVRLRVTDLEQREKDEEEGGGTEVNVVGDVIDSYEIDIDTDTSSPR